MTAGWFADTPEDRAAYAGASLLIDVTEEIAAAMQTANVTHWTLARRTGIPAGFLRRLLRGQDPLTLDIVAKILHAVGYRLEVRAVPIGEDNQ